MIPIIYDCEQDGTDAPVDSLGNLVKLSIIAVALWIITGAIVCMLWGLK